MPNLCRTLLSGALLNYPLPILVNWGLTGDATNEYKLHLAKIEGILSYLRGLPPRNDGDLVFIADGYDVWFQLRPDILISRYYEVNEQLLKRARSGLDPNSYAYQSIKQTVIFGADKKCWPQTPDYPACWAVPNSTLPADAFGDLTDRFHGAEGDRDPPADTFRPRWLNSGTVLGPIRDVREIFEAASQRVNDSYHGDRDQWYFADLFGDQEYFRRELRHQELPGEVNMDNGGKRVPITSMAEAEFYMGLDYESQLFSTMTFSAQDVDFMSFNDTKANIVRLLQKHNVSIDMEDDITTMIPKDIGDSPLPISVDLLTEVATEGTLDIAADMSEQLPINITWGEIPLLVNFPARSIPPIIHMNGNKSHIDPFWKLTWWSQLHLGRHLLRSGSRAPQGPIATTTDADGVLRYWSKGGHNSLLRENGGAWTAQGKWVPWHDVCDAYGEILFEGKDAGEPPNQMLINQEKKKQKALDDARAAREREDKEREDREREQREREEQEREQQQRTAEAKEADERAAAEAINNGPSE